jgi:hypothetical protein
MPSAVVRDRVRIVAGAHGPGGAQVNVEIGAARFEKSRAHLDVDAESERAQEEHGNRNPLSASWPTPSIARLQRRQMVVRVSVFSSFGHAFRMLLQPWIIVKKPIICAMIRA